MKASLAPTPAKMAREMLEADRRAQKRRHRARRARPVHTPPLIRPETFEPGNPPCHREAATRSPSAQPREAASGEAANRRSCGAAYLPRSERSERLCERPASAASRQPLAASSSLCDLLLAAILWGTALVCVGITLAIATGIALHLLGVE